MHQCTSYQFFLKELISKLKLTSSHNEYIHTWRYLTFVYATIALQVILWFPRILTYHQGYCRHIQHILSIWGMKEAISSRFDRNRFFAKWKIKRDKQRQASRQKSRFSTGTLSTLKEHQANFPPAEFDIKLQKAGIAIERNQSSELTASAYMQIWRNTQKRLRSFKE